jgi:hypothetical protein
MWFIEFHFHADGRPVFINFDKVVEMHAGNEGGTLVVFEPDRRWVHVKEEYDMIMKFMLDRMSAGYSKGPLSRAITEGCS